MLAADQRSQKHTARGERRKMRLCLQQGYEVRQDHAKEGRDQQAILQGAAAADELALSILPSSGRFVVEPQRTRLTDVAQKEGALIGVVARPLGWLLVALFCSSTPPLSAIFACT